MLLQHNNCVSSYIAYSFLLWGNSGVIYHFQARALAGSARDTAQIRQRYTLTKPPTSFSIQSNRICCLASALVLLVYGWYLSVHALNVPYHDDIYDILRFILRVGEADHTGQYLDALLERHNDHRTAASRLVFYAVYLVQQVVDFRVLSLVANLALPLMALLYWHTVSSRSNRPLALLVVLLLLCHARYYGLMLWSMSAFAFYFVCLYSFASLYFLSKPSPPRFGLALASALAATYSLSSGQLIWLLGVVALLCRPGPVPRRYLLSWCLAAVFALWSFHANFANPNPLGTVLNFLCNTPIHHARYVLVLLGSGFSFGSVLWAEWLGFVQLCALLFFVYRDRHGAIATLHLFGGFLVLATVALALGRAPYSPLDYAIVPRYSFASINLSCVLVLLGINSRELLTRAQSLAVLILAGSLCVASYLVYHPLLDTRLEWRMQLYNRKLFPLYGQPRPLTDQVIKAAVEADIYRPPPRPLLSHRQQAKRQG